MKIKCEYCDKEMSDNDEKCPNCGATNFNFNSIKNSIPKTIQEFKEWYEANNLPPENVTRFFIGKDIQEPKAFGIYYDYDNEKYVVYKNKADGTRSVRYQGRDEACAVNELCLRLKQEIGYQKRLNNKLKNVLSIAYFPTNTPLFLIHFFSVFVAMFALANINMLPVLFLFLSVNPGIFIMMPIISRIKNAEKARKVENLWHILSFVIFFILLLAPGISKLKLHMNDGYYKSYDNDTYYNYGSDWYYYDDYWTVYDGSTEGLSKVSQNEIADGAITRFEDSSYYIKENFFDSLKTDFVSDGSSSSDSSWDSWDSSDSWDSDSTDWDSDW